mgnify:FL=1
MVYTTQINWQKEVPSIRERGQQGQNMVQIAKSFGITRQRMKQIIDKYIPEWHMECGYAARRKLEAQLTQQKHGDKVDTDLYRAQKYKFQRKKYTAIRTGIEWNIHFGDLYFPDVCPILGLPLDYFAESAVEGSPSFDRINCSLGYVAGNVQVISWRANRIKNDGSAEEHRKIADYLDKLSLDTIAKQDLCVVK